VTVSLDRSATLRQAEKLLRQGRLEQAIAEYRRLVDEQPRDRTTANQLGDLLARAGREREAIDQYSRIADSFAADGFLSKASALYKKILKLAPHDDHALLQAAELAAAQRLLVDARAFFAAAADERRARGDWAGVARIVVRLGTLDPGNVEARLAAAQARVDLDDRLGAIADLAQYATELVEAGNEDDALRVLHALLAIDHANSRARSQLAGILHRRGDTAAASAYLTGEEAAHDPDLTLAVADMRIRRGDATGGIALLDRLLNAGGAPATDAVASMAIALAADEPETAYRIVERVTDACILRNDWPGAVKVLRRFSELHPEHVPALTRLGDLSIASTVASAPERPAVAPPADIEEVFAHLREDAESSATAPGELAFRRGTALFGAGDLESSIDPLRMAAREPARQFAAASLLGTVFERQERLSEAIEWLGHAADAPIGDASDRRRVLLQLADLLERAGEPARALGVCLELQAEAGDYGDVASRIARLSRGHA
jgi:tetratricopeptide (TPR) repeat protein